jgi:hypothetical protein
MPAAGKTEAHGVVPTQQAANVQSTADTHLVAYHPAIALDPHIRIIIRIIIGIIIGVGATAGRRRASTLAVFVVVGRDTPHRYRQGGRRQQQQQARTRESRLPAAVSPRERC